MTFIWFAQLSKAVVHATAAATAASHYFVTHEFDPVSHALRRSLTTSLGSLCFGSLLVSGVKTLQILCSSRPYQRRLVNRLLEQYLPLSPVPCPCQFYRVVLRPWCRGASMQPT